MTLSEIARDAEVVKERIQWLVSVQQRSETDEVCISIMQLLTEFDRLKAQADQMGQLKW